jgi:hypothetical protein
VDVITPVNTVFNQIFKPKASSEKKKTWTFIANLQFTALLLEG